MVHPPEHMLASAETWSVSAYVSLLSGQRKVSLAACTPNAQAQLVLTLIAGCPVVRRWAVYADSDNPEQLAILARLCRAAAGDEPPAQEPADDDEALAREEPADDVSGDRTAPPGGLQLEHSCDINGNFGMLNRRALCFTSLWAVPGCSVMYKPTCAFGNCLLPSKHVADTGRYISWTCN